MRFKSPKRTSYKLVSTMLLKLVIFKQGFRKETDSCTNN